ncbi:site-specific recombinase XerD [Ereboglobus sp. PH5-5]|uniref:tyrosine-type recombinase/integrase n=1 Tax=unclassified Ereboglobus TaxID=2626932 RepID=UPI002407690A|nr:MULTISPECIES: hypothetical protein [unclassified Ereboglobus]MDF9827503.1 site-specific recombinase XerD [Ereboglobus sp. PH5-10]MDF9834145.1 site-specific recombinase XerD [Ereboglobus sp. PH5-5]
MQTKRKPGSKPDANRGLSQQGVKRSREWVPPRGMRYSFRPERKSAPFYLHWRKNGKETALGFKDKASREIKARSLAEARDAHGSEVLTFDPVLWRKYREFQAIVGEGVDPVIVAHEWKKSKQGTARIESLVLTDAVTKYFALRKSEQSWGRDAERHAEKHLKRLCDEHGAKRLSELSREEVREWMDGLVDDEGNPIGPYSKKDHLKHVRTFFDYALRERWGAVENPCLLIKPPKTEDGDPVVIPLRDAFEFFKANRDERVVGRVALEAFGGIRYTTAGLIQKDAVNFENKGLRLVARIHKTGKKDGRTRYRQGHPDNLWTWLAHTPESTWAMSALNYREGKRHAGIRAGIRPSDTSDAENQERIRGLRNVWRHSFISYHLAAFKNTPLTQYLAQHSNPKTTEEYEGVADQTDAARYFLITPDSVKLSWEEFLKLPIKEKKPGTKG